MSLLDRYHEALRARLTKERAGKVDALVSAANDPDVLVAPLARQAGYIRAIDDMLAAMIDVKTELTGGE